MDPPTDPPGPPRKPRNADVRGREHLTPAEVQELAKAAARMGAQGGATR